MPQREQRPYVGFNPTMPQNAAGWRIEPPVSVPVAPTQSCAATAAAGPEREEEGVDLHVSHRVPDAGKAGGSREPSVARGLGRLARAHDAAAPREAPTGTAAPTARFAW